MQFAKELASLDFYSGGRLIVGCGIGWSQVECELLGAEMIFDCGAKAGALVGIGCILLGSMYRWENLQLEGVEVLTNKAGTGAYRGPADRRRRSRSKVPSTRSRIPWASTRWNCGSRTPSGLAICVPTASRGNASAWRMPRASARGVSGRARGVRTWRGRRGGSRWLARRDRVGRRGVSAERRWHAADHAGRRRPDRYQHLLRDDRGRSVRAGQPRPGARDHGQHRPRALRGRFRWQQDHLYGRAGGLAGRRGRARPGPAHRRGRPRGVVRRSADRRMAAWA